MKTKLLQKEKEENHFFNEFGKFNYGKVSSVLINIILFGLIAQLIFLIYSNIFTIEYIVKNINNIFMIFSGKLYQIYSSLTFSDFSNIKINLFLFPLYLLSAYLLLSAYMFYKSKQQLKLSTLGLENYSLKKIKNGYIFKLAKGEEVDFEYIQSISDDIRQIFKIKENKRILISRYKSNDVKIQIKPVLKSFEFNIELLQKGSIYFGKNSNNKDVYINLNNLTHYLIAGSSGSGKSVLQNLIINNLIFNLRYLDSLFLVDLKSGVEFNKYNKLSSKINVVENLQDLYSLTNNLIEIMNIRYEVIKNNRDKIYQPIVVIIDEYASIEDMSHTLDKETYAKLKNNLKTLLAKSRAANMKFFISTQKATSDSIDTTLRNNLQSKILMKTSSKDAQRVVIPDINDISNEFNISVSNFSYGQYIFQDESTQFNKGSVVHYMQSPFVRDDFHKSFFDTVQRNEKLEIIQEHSYFIKLLIRYKLYEPQAIYFRNDSEMKEFQKLKLLQKSKDNQDISIQSEQKNNDTNLDDEIVLRKELYKLAIKHKLKDEAKEIRLFKKHHDDNLSCLNSIIKMKELIASKVKMETKP